LSVELGWEEDTQAACRRERQRRIRGKGHNKGQQWSKSNDTANPISKLPYPNKDQSELEGDDRIHPQNARLPRKQVTETSKKWGVIIGYEMSCCNKDLNKCGVSLGCRQG